MAVIALTRLNGYTNNPEYHKKAQQTLNALAGAAHQYGIFVSTYAIAAVHFSEPHTQVVVVGNDEQAEKLRAAALASFSYGKAVIKINPTMRSRRACHQPWQKPFRNCLPLRKEKRLPSCVGDSLASRRWRRQTTCRGF